MSKLKKLFVDAGLNIYVELIVIAVINLVLLASAVVSYFFTKKIIFIAPSLFLLLLIDLADLWRINYLKRIGQVSLVHEVTLLFRYLYVDLNNDIAVNKALEELKTYASLRLNTLLCNLLESKDDPLTSYLAFAHQFPSVLLEEVMMRLYQYQNKNSKAGLLAFNEAYLKLKHDDDQNSHESRKTRFEFVKSTALVGVAIIVIVVIVVVVILVGEFLHG